MFATAPGPLAQTAAELVLIVREAAFRRGHVDLQRQALRRSDWLMSMVEDVVEQEWRLIPVPLWSAIARLVANVDPKLREALGIDRRPARVATILLEAQGILMQRAQQQKPRSTARIIPLFS